VFGVDHDDLDLSPQADHLSPIKRIQSLGNEDEALPTENIAESDDETTMSNPVVKGSKKHSPADYDDFVSNQPDDDEVEAEEFQTSHQDQDDDRLSVGSPFTEASSTGGSLSTKWRGYSQRILHPPHPLDSLMNIEALIEAALRRAERRKKAKPKKKASQKKSSQKKSSRRDRRKTCTKLVFE